MVGIDSNYESAHEADSLSTNLQGGRGGASHRRVGGIPTTRANAGRGGY